MIFFSEALKLILSFKKMKIYSSGLNYSLVTSKKLQFAFFAILVLHSPKSSYHTFNGGFILIKLLDTIFQT